jgi:hypothetical protein
MTGSTLRRLLDDNERFDFVGRGTVNHLAMALYALSITFSTGIMKTRWDFLRAQGLVCSPGCGLPSM